MLSGKRGEDLGIGPSSSRVDVLYLTYDGVLEPIGQSQVLPYLISLADSGIRFELLSFEKPNDIEDLIEAARLEQVLQSRGIRWTRLRYHGKPRILSTAFDIIVGTWIAVQRSHRAHIRVVHARSYVPALMALAMRWITRTRFLFDMRGFWPEERIDLGIFHESGFLFRLTKWFESLFIREADHLVVLTRRAKRILSSPAHRQDRQHRIEVIPCCVNLGRFPQRSPSRELVDRYELTNKLVVGNLGALSGRYLVPEMFRFGVQLVKHMPELRFVYLTHQDRTLVFSIAEKEGFPLGSLVVAKASPAEVPEWLSLFHYGVFFPKPSYSAQAMCPTKLGELLAAGVPVVTNPGVGDVAEIVEQEGVGILVRGFSDSELSTAAQRVTSTIPVSQALRQTCRRAAATHFALEDGCSRYLSVY